MQHVDAVANAKDAGGYTNGEASENECTESPSVLRVSGILGHHRFQERQVAGLLALPRAEERGTRSMAER